LYLRRYLRGYSMRAFRINFPHSLSDRGALSPFIVLANIYGDSLYMKAYFPAPFPFFQSTEMKCAVVQE